jgi:hypothetical protein
MIRFKFNPLEGKFRDFEYIEGETIHDSLERISKEYKIPLDKLVENVDVRVGVHKIYPEFYSYTKPKDDQDVIIVVKAKGDRLGQILTIVALAVITIYSGGSGGAALAATYGKTAVQVGFAFLSIVAVVGINAIFAPPEPDAGTGAQRDRDQSQMYNIDRQSNTVDKFGFVPKVYGRYKIYPKIAANPYTELGTLNGEQVQFFYAIYDFGYGPMEIDSLRIGETSIDNYSDLEYRLVDPNKPDTSTGPWDDQLHKEFKLYKGDFVVNNFVFGLDDVGDEFQQEAAENVDGQTQDVTLRFVGSSGLFSRGTTTGELGFARVDMSIQFAEVGTEDWINYGDPSFVRDRGVPLPDDIANANLKDFDALDGYTEFSKRDCGYAEIIDEEKLNRISQDPTNGNDYTPGESIVAYRTVNQFGSNINYPTGTYQIQEWGFDVGDTPFLIVDQDWPIGISCEINGYDLGFIRTKTVVDATYTKYEFDPAQFKIVIFNNFFADDITTNKGNWPDRQLYIEPKKRGQVLPIDLNTDSLILFGEQTTAFYKEITIKPVTTNQVKIRVRRRNTAYEFGPSISQDGINWTEVRTKFDVSPISTTNRHVFLELKIKATDQINGTIRNFSAICTSVLDVYDDVSETWSPQPTQNPAWIYADLLTGPINRFAIDKSQLDVDTIKEWADYCDEVPTTNITGWDFSFPRFQVNMIIDYQTTVMGTINQITSTAQASLNIVNGKYGVLIDKEKTVPIQLFTPRNTNTFSSYRNYAELPDAISVRYIDPASRWELRTVDVYNNGKDKTNSTRFDTMEAFGTTNIEQAFRFGRYMFAQAIYRQEVITFEVDFENLVCTRGDYVVYQQDIMKMGGTPTRVKEVAGNTITIDDSFTFNPLLNYGYTLRESNGDITTSTMTILNATQATVDGNIPTVGDLLVWGEVNKITTDWIVKAIEPQDDLKARITLVEKNDAIFDAERDELFGQYDPEISNDTSDPLTAPEYVTNLQETANTWDCDGSSYVYYIDLTWEEPLSSIWELYEVYVNIDSKGYELVTSVTANTYRYIGDTANQGLSHNFKILAVNSQGVKKDILGAEELVSTLDGKTELPSDVTEFFGNVTNETLQLDWNLLEDCDVAEYRIRFTPITDSSAAWENSVFLVKTAPQTDYVFVQARTGTYFIKARDRRGNDSTVAASVVTSIPELFNLNVIDEINDFPTFPGVFDRTEAFGDTIILQDKNAVLPSDFEPEGFYYFQNLLDLGEIYSVRLQAYIVAGGFSKEDVMANWVTLASISQLTNSTGSDYNVELQYRSTDTLNVIAEWTTLSSITAMSTGLETVWTSWRRFTIGDFTGRVFQFRLKLQSFVNTISPQIFEGKVIADMPDRIYNLENLVAPINGFRVDFDPEFKGPTKPNIQITQDNASQGDYYNITNADVSGFDIEFFDSNNNSVSRQFDVAVKGYGRLTDSVI